MGNHGLEDWEVYLLLICHVMPRVDEALRQACDLQAVALAHSWGDAIFRNFLTWTEQEQPGWTERHVHAYANIAGPTLGVPKAVTSLLSGTTLTLSLSHLA